MGLDVIFVVDTGASSLLLRCHLGCPAFAAGLTAATPVGVTVVGAVSGVAFVQTSGQPVHALFQCPGHACLLAADAPAPVVAIAVDGAVSDVVRVGEHILRIS